MPVDLDWKDAGTLESEQADALYRAWLAKRKRLYQELSDPVFMEYQRGEASYEEWIQAVSTVKGLSPKPM